MIIAALALAAAAARGPGLIPVYIYAERQTCGAWVEERSNPWRGNSLQAWLLGYMTAHNEYRTPAIHVEVPSMNVWLDNYCKAHPLSNLAQAVYTMAGELEKSNPYKK